MDIPKKECANIVESVFEIIKDGLTKGDEVTIPGFGKWSVKKKFVRKDHNPQTGKDVKIDVRKEVTFKYSGKWKSGIDR